LKAFSLVFLALAACAPKPQSIPHNVYCLTPAQYKALVDAEPKKIGQSLSKDWSERDKQLTTQNILVRRYADGLLDVLGGCVGSS
jgi:hypothetical protein